MLERPERAAGGTAVTSFDEGRAAELRDHFERRHWVLLRGLIGPRFLAELHDELERAPFAPRADSMAGELTLYEHVPLVARMLFLVNDPAVHRAVEAATGIERIARFDGRINRRAATPDHYHVWHDDVDGERRLVAMSLNLSTEPYEGGVLQLRRKGAAEPPDDVPAPSPGDALLFRVRSDLEHCVTAVSAGTRTSLVGWFGSEPPWPLPAGLSSARGSTPGQESSG